MRSTRPQAGPPLHFMNVLADGRQFAYVEMGRSELRIASAGAFDIARSIRDDARYEGLLRTARLYFSLLFTTPVICEEQSNEAISHRKPREQNKAMDGKAKDFNAGK